MIYLCKARLYIHGYNYLVFSFYFQHRKIIIAITSCAVKMAFSQKNKSDILIVRQSFFSNKTDIFLLTI